MSTILSQSSVQEALIDIGLNGVFVNLLLFGVYTMVYFGTSYIYLTKKSSRHWIVLLTISLLYFLYVLQTSAQWVVAKQAFVDQGKTRETILSALFVNPQWGTFVTLICNFLMSCLADALLIWRCYNVWNRSLYVILLPSFLLFSEFVIYVTTIILASIESVKPSHAQAHVLNTLTTTSLFTTLTTTLVTALLISYRIHSVVKQDLLRSSRARLNHIFTILLESSAAYSIVALAYAVSGVIPANANKNPVPLIATETYSAVFYYFTAGVAPTIMVARVALTTDTDWNISTMSHISGIQFDHSHSKTKASIVRPEDRDIEETTKPRTFA
ncbi:hypothetical protein CPB84DRAFT_1304485 [Gymnopilus junonius]|uniref:Uncharacterized protein n=1 Tax=Gymnopilus junonius TaxID=109634 RepID=A0A9P5TLY3_GYMJU|nr:hypothetical protein CPB84DRAFT_1304485 [Gymnopilus junonius]